MESYARKRSFRKRTADRRSAPWWNGRRASPGCFICPRCRRADEPRVTSGPPLAGHGAATVRDAIARTIATLPAQFRQSLTWGQGSEMVRHADIRIGTGLAVYLCDQQGPWPPPSPSPRTQDRAKPWAGKLPRRRWADGSNPSTREDDKWLARRPLDPAQRAFSPYFRDEYIAKSAGASDGSGIPLNYAAVSWPPSRPGGSARSA